MDNTQVCLTVVIPCYNEEKTIKKVITDFQRHLPEAEIIVYDNNSTDQTVKIAQAAGVKVLHEKRQGKGQVVKSMFDNIQADIYVLVDGDDTYPAEAARKLIKPVLDDEVDVVVGTRLEGADNKTLRPLHQIGNRIILGVINLFFRTNFKDILSGYRIMGKKFVHNVPLLSSGFEIETELTLQALERGFRIKEIPIKYRERPVGSQSKLKSFQDGSKIIFTIMSILRDYRPMTFFPLVASLFVLIGLIFGSTVIIEYYQTGFVTKLPRAVLSVSLILISSIVFVAGFVVETINRRFRETHILFRRQIQSKNK
ncbi:glycosyltransferase family 2 protein [Patescibacteria group bacterium]|nr:glycosyltransferase family 2 protein [Patescibacteria group bacterium]